jgi:hypothetical protein
MQKDFIGKALELKARLPTVAIVQTLPDGLSIPRGTIAATAHRALRSNHAEVMLFVQVPDVRILNKPKMRTRERGIRNEELSNYPQHA